MLDGAGRLIHEQQRYFEEALRKIRKEQEEADERRKREPYLNFMESATAHGFSRDQADFLWSMRLMQEPRLF